MKPTFHQWCTAAAVAILILGALFILGQLYPAEATTQTFDSCGPVECPAEWEPAEVTEPDHPITAEELTQIEEESQVDPTAPPTTPAEEETSYEPEGEPNETTRARGPIPQGQSSVPTKDSVQRVLHGCTLHRTHRLHLSRRHSTRVHHHLPATASRGASTPKAIQLRAVHRYQLRVLCEVPLADGTHHHVHEHSAP
jgi:hypothetical protein